MMTNYQINEMNAEFAQQFDKMKSERDALAARVEKLEAALKRADREPMLVCDGKACYVGNYAIRIERSGKLTWRRQGVIKPCESLKGGK